MTKLVTAASEGFFGSFRLAVAIVMAVVGVASAFVHGGPNAATDASKHSNK